MSNFKYDAILYDLDGTLIDSVPIIVESFIGAYVKVFGRCDRTEEDFKSYIGKPLVSTFAMHEEKEAKALLEAYLEINLQMLREDKANLFEGVEEGLIALHEMGIKQGIVTSKRTDSASITIDIKNFDRFFETYVCFEDSEKHKPDGEPILVAMKNLGIKDPKRVLYVGDALPDALCARNAGCDFALVDWSVMPREEILSSIDTRVIGSIEALSCII